MIETDNISSGIDAGVKIRPTEEELKQMDSWSCPDFRSGWDSYFKNAPDKPVMHYSGQLFFWLVSGSY